MKNRSFGSGYVRMHGHRQAAPTLVIGEHENNVRTLHPGTCGWQVDSQEKRNDLGERMSHRLVANIAVVSFKGYHDGEARSQITFECCRLIRVAFRCPARLSASFPAKGWIYEPESIAPRTLAFVGTLWVNASITT